MSDFIPFIKPNFPNPKLITEDLEKIYANNYYSNNGPFYFEFKKSLDEYLGQGIKSVIVANATLGLMMAIKAIFNQPYGDKKYIAVPSFTFAAAAHSIKWCGFEPIFFDVEVENGQPSLSSFNELLTLYGDELAGVVLINNFGIGNEKIDEWDQVLNGLNLPYIIDSAPGFGSTYGNGEKIGGYGKCEVFSFHATKPFGIGEGGLITTKDKSLAKRLEMMKNFGFDEHKDVKELALNAKITELDCAIGLRVLEGYETTLKDRKRTHAYYEKGLAGKVAFIDNATTSSIQFATIIVENNTVRESILKSLKQNNIEARTYYAPGVHALSMFNQSKRVELTNTEILSSTVISLPVHANMSESTVHKICDIIRNEL